LSINAATNRITTSGFAYNAAGQMTQWPGGTVTLGADYDVDGRLSVVKEDGTAKYNYAYDARNRRVRRKDVSGNPPKYEVYGPGGELLGVYGGYWYMSGGQWDYVFRVEEERIYFAGRVVARLDESGSPKWEKMDRLGSVKPSVRYPFGEGNEWNPNDEFATYPIDRRTGHYYAWNRFYSATWGRFSSPDPYVMSGGLTHPQGWNRYSYVGNDPVNYFDPSGLQAASPMFYWQCWESNSDAGYSCALRTQMLWDGGVQGGPIHFLPGGLEVGVGGEPGLIQSKHEAKRALQEALAWLSEECFRKLGVMRAVAMEKAGQIMIFDGRLSEDGSALVHTLLGSEINVANNATFRSVSAYQRAVVLPWKSGDLSKYLVLGASFFDGDQTRTDQLVTLAHESFHYTLNLRDMDLARLAGYKGRSVSAASTAFSEWLKQGCK